MQNIRHSVAVAWRVQIIQPSMSREAGVESARFIPCAGFPDLELEIIVLLFSVALPLTLARRQRNQNKPR